MGTIAARKANEILNNTRYVIAMELICAAQAIDLRSKGATRQSASESDLPKWHDKLPTRLGDTTNKAYEFIRTKVSFMDTDRVIAPDIEEVVGLIKCNRFLD